MSKLTSLQRREIALAALCDETTLLRVLNGEPVRESSRERVKRALRERGLLHLLPPEPAR